MDIQWKCNSSRDSELYIFTVGKFTATVQDCDGDFSRWWIDEGDVTKKVGCNVYDDLAIYHTDIAKEEAIKALISLARDKGLFK